MPKWDVIVAGAGPAGSSAAKWLADHARSVLLVDKAAFPRPKICGGWVNRKVFLDFEDLIEHREALTESAFYGLVIHNSQMSKQAEYREDEPVGYLVLREKFDAGLVDLAKRAGAELIQAVAVDKVENSQSGVTVTLCDGSTHTAAALIGADGASSTVARQTGINPGWDQAGLVICCNEDIPLDEAVLDGSYGVGRDRRIHVWPAYDMIPGFAWLFPKRRHAAVGLGGRTGGTQNISLLYDGFLARLKENAVLADGAPGGSPRASFIPASGAYQLPSHVKGRTVVVGDAGGFAAGATGEGIYYGMWSARCAAKLIDEGLANGDLDAALSRFDETWKRQIGQSIEAPSGALLASLLAMVFTSRKAVNKISRSFLYGESLSVF